MPQVYNPAEDSYLIKKYIPKFAKGRTLDLGTGSGILAIEAAKHAKEVIAADINPDALKEAKMSAKEIKNIQFISTNLFSKIKGKFDCILFNAPYLPSNQAFPDEALDGGKKGYEIVLSFLNQSINHLENSGNILIIFSSLSKPKVILQEAENLLLDYELIESQHVFFEDILLFRLSKSPLLIDLESRGLKSIRWFSKGKRGSIYTALKKSAKVAIKMPLTENFALQIESEVGFLKRLNKIGIGPKFLFSSGSLFAYKFVEGDFIIDFLKKADKKAALNVIQDVFGQCKKLDDKKINKFEMVRPIKHIIVTKKQKPIMIDFERCRFVVEPKNVTQFCQFITSSNITPILAAKGINLHRQKILDICKKYKHGKADFKKIKEQIV